MSTSTTRPISRDRAFVAAERELRRGAVGRLYQVDCEWSFPATHGPERYAHPHTDWRGHMENWGGVFQDHGSHTVDLRVAP